MRIADKSTKFCATREITEEESMHNIDRTNLESNYGEYSGEYTGEYGGTEFGYETGEQESETYGEYTQEGTFSEADEMELAAELLSVSNEAELDQFLGKLFKKAGAFIKGPVGQKLLGGLKSIAKKALPTLGGAVGNLIAPGIGGAIGSNLASQAGSMFGLELEGLSYEDQEFEVAKQIVRLGGAAASNAAQAGSTAPAAEAAKAALTAAAQQFAPGLLRNGAAQSQGTQGRQGARCRHANTGRWIRRGKAIVILQA